jgi:hypothetical protein
MLQQRTVETQTANRRGSRDILLNFKDEANLTVFMADANPYVADLNVAVKDIHQ